MYWPWWRQYAACWRIEQRGFLPTDGADTACRLLSARSWRLQWLRWNWRGFLSAVGSLVMVSLPGRLPDVLVTVEAMSPVGAFNGVDPGLRMEQMRSGAYYQCDLGVYNGCDGASCLLWAAL